MTKYEIFSHIYTNVPYTHTNGLRAWSDWIEFSPDNYGALFDAARLAQGFTIEIKKSENKYRIKCIL